MRLVKSIHRNCAGGTAITFTDGSYAHIAGGCAIPSDWLLPCEGVVCSLEPAANVRLWRYVSQLQRWVDTGAQTSVGFVQRAMRREVVIPYCDRHKTHLDCPHFAVFPVGFDPNRSLTPDTPRSEREGISATPTIRLGGRRVQIPTEPEPVEIATQISLFDLPA